MKFPPGIKVYGDKSYRGACPKEAVEQITFFNRIRKTELGNLALHIRNEGKRNHMQNSRQKAEGMLVGASDIVILGAIPFICELKRRDHTKCTLSTAQATFLEDAQAAGCFVCIALSADDVMSAIKEWTESF